MLVGKSGPGVEQEYLSDDLWLPLGPGVEQEYLYSPTPLGYQPPTPNLQQH